jgi:hypothetical protein
MMFVSTPAFTRFDPRFIGRIALFAVVLGVALAVRSAPAHAAVSISVTPVHFGTLARPTTGSASFVLDPASGIVTTTQTSQGAWVFGLSYSCSATLTGGTPGTRYLVTVTWATKPPTGITLSAPTISPNTDTSNPGLDKERIRAGSTGTATFQVAGRITVSSTAALGTNIALPNLILTY